MIDKITFLLGLIGTLGTAYSMLMTFYWNRVDIDFYIADYSATSDSLILYMVFTNNSRLPVSVTDVCIWNKAIPYSCQKDPSVVRIYSRQTGKNTIYRETLKSLPFPINLPSLSGTSGYLYFLIPQENFECASSSLTVELSTNRLRKLQKTLELPMSSHTAR